jgi:hypothetical protein
MHNITMNTEHNIQYQDSASLQWSIPHTIHIGTFSSLLPISNDNDTTEDSQPNDEVLYHNSNSNVSNQHTQQHFNVSVRFQDNQSTHNHHNNLLNNLLLLFIQSPRPPLYENANPSLHAIIHLYSQHVHDIYNTHPEPDENTNYLFNSNIQPTFTLQRDLIISRRLLYNNNLRSRSISASSSIEFANEVSELIRDNANNVQTMAITITTSTSNLNSPTTTPLIQLDPFDIPFQSTIIQGRIQDHALDQNNLASNMHVSIRFQRDRINGNRATFAQLIFSTPFSPRILYHVNRVAG